MHPPRARIRQATAPPGLATAARPSTRANARRGCGPGRGRIMPALAQVQPSASRRHLRLGFGRGGRAGRAARSCGVCKDATRETTTPPPPTCIELHLCHAMGWVGETISHLRRTSSRPFRVAAPDLGCNETIGVEHELHRCSKPPQACALCHGGAL